MPIAMITSHVGGATRVTLKNISIGVKKGTIDRIWDASEVGLLMTMKLTMKGIMISIVTGADIA